MFGPEDFGPEGCVPKIEERSRVLNRPGFSGDLRV
jgi:hypothetical protein